ncbi:hypothetical protein IWQ62_004556 [Dispira parvispora]|uniref:DUF3752 domain-containing protein n=1 Tax=Dispira parvispora TaxID=1520584 RepID=A0A9W8ARM4_9FUNG|nr:hypothetical protein IWQ62_004556 [Dispira parvispora]
MSLSPRDTKLYTGAAKASSSQGTDEDEAYGPPLPPEMLAERQARVVANVTASPQTRASQPAAIGPYMPENFSTLLCQNTPNPGHNVDDSDDDKGVIGPKLPAVAPLTSTDRVSPSLSPTATSLVNRQSDPADESTTVDESRRADWMLCPPPGSTLSADPLQIQNRRFQQQKSDQPLFDPSWLEVPSGSGYQSKSSRESLKQLTNHPRGEEIPQGPARPSQKDQEVAAAIEEYNHLHRSKSLLEEHMESMSSDKRSKHKKSKRFHHSSRHHDRSYEPFSRERDVPYPRVDTRRQRELLSDTAFLSSKFSRGKRKGFL